MVVCFPGKWDNVEPHRRHAIQFEEDGRRRLAWVSEEAKGGKLVVRTADGRERRIPRSRVRLVLPAPVESWKALDELSRTAASLQEDIDVKSLWEFALEMGEEVSLEDLGELLFESLNNARILALHRALSEDRLYFRAKKTGYEPRQPENVREIIQQEEALRRKEQEIQETIALLTRIMAIRDEEELRENINYFNELHWTRRYVDWLRHLAIHGEDKAREEAIRITRQVDMPEGKRFRSLERRAFEILVVLGELDEHANIKLMRLGFKARFPEDVEHLAASVSPNLEGRRDLRDLLVFSIDDPWTRDLDDALSVQKLDDGWLVGVHIADPASVMSPGAPLDMAARERGATIYLPDGNIPMLPRSISESNLSLVEGEDRPALSFLVKISEIGEIAEYEIVPSVIRSSARLDYETVTKDLNERVLPEEIHNSLVTLYNISRKLERKRAGRGAVSVNLPDVKVKLLPNGVIDVHLVDTSSPSRLLVSEFMILCNTVAGMFARKHGLPVIYRTQKRPEDLPARVDTTSIIGALDILSRLKRGEFSAKPAPHHGLGVDVYLQVSSPLRRYTDLLAHYQLKAFLQGQDMPFTSEQIYPILGTADSVAWEAAMLERDSNRYWLFVYFRENAGHLLIRGTVVETRDPRRYKATVFLNDYGLRVNVMFGRPVERGMEHDFMVKKVDPRGDVLFLDPVD